VNLNDLSHHVRLWKGNVMEIAAAQERIGQVLFGIGSDNNDGPVFRLYGLVDLNDIEFHLVQYIEHIVLKISICLINFIDQQDYLFVCNKGLAYFAHSDVVFDIAHISAGISKAAVIQPCEGIILIKGLHKLHAGFDVKHYQFHI